MSELIAAAGTTVGTDGNVEDVALEDNGEVVAVTPTDVDVGRVELVRDDQAVSDGEVVEEISADEWAEAESDGRTDKDEAGTAEKSVDLLGGKVDVGEDATMAL